MRSLIIIEVEHGEATDPMEQIIHKLQDPVHQAVWGYKVNDYTVRVDLPECFVLNSGDGQGTCQCHTDIHPFNDDCVGFQDAL